MLISRALVKIFSEQLPSFICWTLDFGELHGIISELRALNRALNTIFWGIRESIKRTFPEHYPLDPTADCMGLSMQSADCMVRSLQTAWPPCRLILFRNFSEISGFPRESTS